MRYTTIVALIAVSLAACNKPAEQAAPLPPTQAADQASGGTAPGPSPQHGMVMSTTIIITNSGSTNTIGWRILIGANGEASYVSGTDVLVDGGCTAAVEAMISGLADLA